MEDFRTISVVLSMVLGLGVTRLLLGGVTVFRIRRNYPIDWLPVSWAVYLFLTQLQYWWAINTLPSLKPAFAFTDFVFLVLLTLMLFLASALLLPSRTEDETVGLRNHFETDGRFGLLALAGFLALAAMTNILFFDAPVLAVWSALDFPLIALPLLVFGTRSRRIQAAATLVYLPLLAIDIWISITL